MTSVTQFAQPLRRVDAAFAIRAIAHWPPRPICWAGRFRAYWEQQGGLAQFGYPLSEEFPERSALSGQVYTVQYFERAVFEYHPENPAPYQVLLSQLGTLRYHERYP
jgi:hypothetical protein